MKVTITGAAGFLGQKLARALLAGRQLIDGQGVAHTVEHLLLADVVAPAADIAAAPTGSGSGSASESGSGSGPRDAAAAALDRDWSSPAEIRLHLRATPFQLKVWEALLRIPTGRLASYGDVAAAIGRPGAGRAVGTAIGANPVAWLIPCHRVIRQSGATGGYMWGPARKQAIIGWESARCDMAAGESATARTPV